MNSCKFILAQAKAINFILSTARGSSAGRVRFQGDNKRPAEGEELNALVANTVKAVLTTNKHKKFKVPSDSGLEDE